MNIIVTNITGLNRVDKKFEPKYFINKKLCFVTPYIFTYKLFTKKRWIGKEIQDVLSSEFGAYGKEYFINSIKKGYIKVNYKNITCDYIIKNNDFIEHKLLFFEKPILNNLIIILYEDENFICVHKPSSIPMHPIGSYQYNSLLKMLQNYLSYQKNNEIENYKLKNIIKVNFLFNFSNNNLDIYDDLMNTKKKKKEYLRKESNEDTRNILNFLCNDLKNTLKKNINKNELNEKDTNVNNVINYEMNKENKNNLNDKIPIFNHNTNKNTLLHKRKCIEKENYINELKQFNDSNIKNNEIYDNSYNKNYKRKKKKII